MSYSCTFAFHNDYNEIMKGFTQKDWKAFVYFISDGRFIKIGRTKDVFKRFCQIKNGNPNGIKLIGLIPFETVEESIEAENEIHQDYFTQKVSGEWYYISETDVATTLDDWDGNCKRELWDKWEREVRYD